MRRYIYKAKLSIEKYFFEVLKPSDQSKLHDSDHFHSFIILFPLLRVRWPAKEILLFYNYSSVNNYLLSFGKYHFHV